MKISRGSSSLSLKVPGPLRAIDRRHHPSQAGRRGFKTESSGADRLAQCEHDRLFRRPWRPSQPHRARQHAERDSYRGFNGGLSTLAQQTPDGTVPRMATFGSPAGVGEDPNTHTIVGYHANQQPGAQKRDVVDDYLMATRGTPSLDSEWMNGFRKISARHGRP